MMLQFLNLFLQFFNELLLFQKLFLLGLNLLVFLFQLQLNFLFQPSDFIIDQLAYLSHTILLRLLIIRCAQSNILIAGVV